MRRSATRAVAIGSDKDRRGFGAQIANLLSESRLVLSGAWLVAFAYDARSPQILGSIALSAAVSDFVDGRVARQTHSADAFGRWLDNLADVIFVLTALTCEVVAGAIPAYIPALIAISFVQYAIDSVLISGSLSPVRSRLGHWGGVINFALVILLALAPYPQWPGALVREFSPLLAIFYLCAIFERALSYELRS